MKPLHLSHCPTCKRAFAACQPCKHCKKLLCKYCNFDGACMECFMTRNKDKEVEMYFEDKIKCETGYY